MRKAGLFIFFLVLFTGCQESAQQQRPRGRFEEVSEEIERLKAESLSQATIGDNIRVDIDMLSTKLSEYSGIDALWQYVNRGSSAVRMGASGSSAGLRVGVAAGDFRVRLNIVKEQLKSSEETNLFLVLADGASGYIFVGKEIAVPRFYYYGRWYSAVDYEFRQAGKSLQVTARKLGNGMISMDLVPVFSNFLEDGRSLELTELQTTVMAWPGQQVVIGGGSTNKDDVATALFSYGESSERKQTLITVTPRIQ